MSIIEQKVAKVAESTNDDQNRRAQFASGGKAAGAEKKELFRFEGPPNRKEILNFTNQLSIMIRAGISLQESLESIGSQTEKVKFKVIILDLKARIEAGESFSQALRAYPDVFSSLYMNMVAAAEISGSLSSMLQKLAEYLDQEAETRSQVVGAMVYPLIIAGMAVVTVLFMLIFVLPRFLLVFAGNEDMLPAPTKIIMAVSTGLRSYWYIIVPSVAGFFFGFGTFIKTVSGRKWWDATKLRMPLVKTLCRCLYITRGLHTMGVLTNAGVSILDTIAITAQVSGNVLFEAMWKGVHEAVRQGKKIAPSLASYGLLPGGVIQMIQSGEESGSLGEVLGDVADFYSRELRTVIKMVTSMIEPIMIIFMGLLVGFIAMSVILPIFKMSSLVTK
ncbi:MAG TPA: type II secretion system F family protein [Phycisphaerales bacterium]|nr:type II secretion system F family protein [Phycisphaerales bacterium]